MWIIKYLVALIVLCCQTTGTFSRPDEAIQGYPYWIMEMKIGTRNLSPRKPIIINEGSSSCNCGNCGNCGNSGSSVEISEKKESGRRNKTIEEIMAKSTLPLVNLNGSLYYYETTQTMNYFAAMQFCRQKGMELVSIETAAENERIMNYIKTKVNKIDHFWTSGNDLSVEGKYNWLSTGEPFSFVDWKPPTPDNLGDEDCVEIRDFGGDRYGWNDMACMHTLNFICEAKVCTDFCLQ